MFNQEKLSLIETKLRFLMRIMVDFTCPSLWYFKNAFRVLGIPSVGIPKTLVIWVRGVRGYPKHRDTGDTQITTSFPG